MDPKVRSIEEWPRPRNITDIQAFLGLANYNRKFVEGYSRLALPLTSLTKKDTRFIWTEKQERAFQQLKQACIQSPTLMLFDTKKPVQVETDASDLAMSACLTQEHNGKIHPKAYFSGKMTPAEQNYEIYDKNC